MLSLGLKVLQDKKPKNLKNDSEYGKPSKTFSIDLHSLYKYLKYSSGFVRNESKIINIMEPDVTDYGKYTVSELRKIAIARGIIEDGEKPKKTRLIELLSA